MPTSALTATGDWPLLIQPGWQDSGPEHWQSHWQQRLGARRVHNRDWHAPQLEEWLAGLHAGLDDTQGRKTAQHLRKALNISVSGVRQIKRVVS